MTSLKIKIHQYNYNTNLSSTITILDSEIHYKQKTYIVGSVNISHIYSYDLLGNRYISIDFYNHISQILLNFILNNFKIADLNSFTQDKELIYFYDFGLINKRSNQILIELLSNNSNIISDIINLICKNSNFNDPYESEYPIEIP